MIWGGKKVIIKSLIIINILLIRNEIFDMIFSNLLSICLYYEKKWVKRYRIIYEYIIFFYEFYLFVVLLVS